MEHEQMMSRLPTMHLLDPMPMVLRGNDRESHKQWMAAFWHASRLGGKISSSISTEALRYVPSKDQEFLDGFYRWYDHTFPFVRYRDAKFIKDQTHLTVLAFPEVRDFSMLGTLNHGMLLTFYVDDRRRELNLEGLIRDSSADSTVHEFTERIRRELPNAYSGFMDLFREFCAANLLQGRVDSSEHLYSRIKSKTMGIAHVHYLLWSLRRLPSEKFGHLKLHNYLHYLELDTMMVNDRHSLQKESGSNQWNGMAVHGLDDRTHNSMIRDNYAHLIFALGELLATEDDHSCVGAYENFKICADATKTWEEFSPRYKGGQGGIKTEEQRNQGPPNLGFPHGPTGLGTAGLRINRRSPR